jgi:acyl carrier protein
MIVVDIVRQTVASLAKVPVPDDPSVSLFEKGVIDSFGVIELVARLEEAFAITVPDADMIPRTFETLERIAAYVEKRRTAGM